MKNSGKIILIAGLLLSQLRVDAAMRMLSSALISKAGIVSYAAKQAQIQAAQIVLGVSSIATWSDIRKAYLARVIEVHPDQGGTSEEFRQVQEAYEFLQANRSSINDSARNINKADSNQSSSQYAQKQKRKYRFDDYFWPSAAGFFGIGLYVYAKLYGNNYAPSVDNQKSLSTPIQSDLNTLPQENSVNVGKQGNVETLIIQSLGLNDKFDSSPKIEVVDNNLNQKIALAISAGLIIAGIVAYKKGYFDNSIGKAKKVFVWCKNKCMKK